MAIIANCGNCGAENVKTWKHQQLDVCDECWLEVAMDLNGRAYRSAADQLQEPSIPRSSGSPRIRHSTGNVVSASSQTLTTGNSGRLRGGLDDLGVKGSCSQLPQEYSPPRKMPIQTHPRWRVALRKLLDVSVNSQCLLCARWYYGAKMEQCSRCGGRCIQRTDHDLGLMGRHASQFIEGNS